MYTDYKSLENELLKEREKNLAQSVFITRLSHNMRTAITAVIGVSEVMLHDTDLPVHAQEAFEKINISGEMLLGAANDILDFPKIESGELPLKNAEYDTIKLIGDITQLHLIHLLNKRIDYKVDINPNIPQILIGDELRIKQVLDSFLTNAFRFTETGVIEVSARWESIEQKKGNLVFVLNYSAHDDEVNSLESDEIVKMLHVVINANSTNDSTRVRISIPQECESNVSAGKIKTNELACFKSRKISSAKKFEREPMPYARALVVDDVDACLFVMKGLLGFYEIETETVTNGNEAIEKIIGGNVYDIIFMDHIMPNLDGVIATRTIREMGYTRPIVALTANAFVHEEDYLKNGFDAYMSKPLNPKKLDGILHNFVRDVQPQEVLDAVSAREKPKPQKKQKTKTRSEIKEKLRLTFARKHKNVFTEITAALGNGEPRTARWLLDSVKNIAGMIGEPILTKIATDTEIAISEGEIPTRLLEMLNRELTTVFAGIQEHTTDATKILSIDEARTLFDTLHDLLSTDRADSIHLIERLYSIQNSEKLIYHIENFEFPKALDALAELRTELEAKIWTRRKSY
ncbi:MAG: response regulator [Defluviitaleaceae bacterium]|nr:response regulator [Defluviitaleaceae bacterium]